MEIRGHQHALADGGVFVCGVWRSGTSLLYALMNQHPDVALMYETDLPTFWPLFTPHRRGWPARAEFWNSAFSRHQLDDIQEQAGEVSGLAAASEFVYRAYAQRRNAKVWGDKSPTYSGYCPELAKLFPKARFIIIWRDPADICRSVLDAASGGGWFARPGTITRALFAAEKLMTDIQWLRANNREFYQLTYDQLVNEPERVMREISEFLGIPYDPRMTTLQGADRSAVYEGQHHSSVKSEAIRSTRKTSQLPDSLRTKISRYRALWKQRYGSDWPTDEIDIDRSSLPAYSERVLDGLAVLILRIVDGLILLFYCTLPIMALNHYRKLKRPRAVE